MEMIKDIKSIPVFRPLIGLVIGILAYKWITFPFQWLILIIIASFIFLSSILIFRLAFKPGLSWIVGFVVHVFFICTGMSIMCRFYASNKPIPEDLKEFRVGVVLTEPVVKNKFARFEMSIFLDSIAEEYIKAQVLMQVKNSFVIPQAGQLIVLKTKPEKIQAPMNPGEFDYAAYLENMGILYRCFVKDGEWKTLAHPKKLTLKFLTLKMKNQLWEKIENLEGGNRNLGVLYAISLGSKDLLTSEIRESYIVTGTMHVLVVSGQHIALIWMVLSYIFYWVKELRWGKFIQFFLIIGLIWFYAMMTGMTASVVRASAMFTLVSLGKIIQKETSIYNSLCVSAFILLLISPQWLADPGFQLSYIAVLSIVFFQPKILFLWTPPSWLLQKIWEITSVSIAAQIGTLPLTLFYFNRFPPWFILSNILVIPLVTIIMILFITMLIFLMIPLVFSIILKVILFLIGVMNASLMFIEGLPSPMMDNIYITNFQMFCFVGTLLGIIFFMRYKKNNFLILGLISLLFFISDGNLRKYHSLQQREIVLFSIPGKMIIGLFEGSKGVFIHNSTDPIDFEESISFKCRPYIIRKGIDKIEFYCIYDSLEHDPGFTRIPGNQNFIFKFGCKSVAILNDPEFFCRHAVFNTLRNRNSYS